MARDSNDEGGDAFPRAPTQEEWDRMSPEERAEVVESLPSEYPLEQWAKVFGLPEGDRHFGPMVQARFVLRDYFARTKTRVYVGTDLAVYYPGEHVFSPDVMVVKDVEGHDRERWVVSAEGKGLDWVLEVHVSGDRKKDAVRNVGLYARLRIPEYFIYDRPRERLDGFRLPSPEATSYQPMESHGGRYDSAVLGLTLGIRDGRLRFWAGNEELPDHEELVSRLEAATRRCEEESQRREEETRRREEETRRREEETRRREEETRRREEETRRREEETRRREEAERRLAAIQAELERFK
jgi:hypothetical protein